MPGDVRLIQLARILELPADGTDEAAVRAAASARPEDLAEALFYEAASSDDVIDTPSARAYLDARLDFLGDLIPPEAVPVIRARFEERLRAWD